MATPNLNSTPYRDEHAPGEATSNVQHSLDASDSEIDDFDTPDAPLPPSSDGTSAAKPSRKTRNSTRPSEEPQDEAGPAGKQKAKGLMGRSPQWLTYAVASGGCAAMNGVFAKLTTTTSTQTLAASLARILGLSHAPGVVEIGLRGIFFTLNILSNATMWFLFTRALTLATSTTRVAVLNTSSNFLVTAVLGMLIFSEGLPLLWWCGAALLVAGSVVIGRRDEGGDKVVEVTGLGGGEGGIVLEGTAGDEYRDEDGDQDANNGISEVSAAKEAVEEDGKFQAYTDDLNEEQVWGGERPK